MVRRSIRDSEPRSPAVTDQFVRSGFFESTDGTRLYYEAQEPEGRPRACVVIVHGYDDHAGRYQSLGRHLASEGFCAFAFDYRGHGKAAGKRGHCVRFEDFLDDLECALSVAKAISDHLPVVLLAQSHGALIALRWLCEPDRARGRVDAAVLSSPYLGPAFSVSWFESLALMASSHLLPGLTFSNRLRAEQLTHDAEMIATRKRDSLIHHVATARWFTESRRAQHEVASRLDQLAIPTLWLIGGADLIADSDVGLQRYESAGGEKDLRRYEGFYHELFNEVGGERVVSDLTDWLHARYPSDSVTQQVH